MASERDVCHRCRGRLQGHQGPRCPWCGGRLGPDPSGRLGKRFALVALVAGVVGVFGLLVPARGWGQVGVTVYGVVAVFMLAMAWVLSGEMVDG